MRLLRFLAPCLFVLVAHAASAQSDPEIDLDAPIPPDITRDFSATYGFPVVENRVLMIDDSFELIKPFGRQITPFGIPLTYDIGNLRKPWNSYLALRRYAASEQRPEDSMAVLEPIVDAQGRSFILSQISMPPLIGLSTHDTFANHVFTKGDEFDVEAFNRLIKNLYGAAPPLSGTVQVLNLKTIDFGAYGFGPQAIPIFGISELATSFGAYGSDVIFPDHALRAQVAIPEGEAKPKIRQLPHQGSYLPTRPRGEYFENFSRSGTLAVAGRLVIPPNPEDPVRYYVDQLALYTDSTMSKPVPGIELHDIFLDIGTARRAEPERLRLEGLRAEAQRQAREAAYMLERTERNRQSARHAAAALAKDIAAAKAAYEQELARVSDALDGLTLDLLGVSLGMTERQVLAGLRKLRGGYEIGYANRSGRAEFAAGCAGGIYSGNIAARTAFNVQTGSVIEAENQRAADHAVQFHLEDNPNCRADLQAFGPSITASVKLGFIGQDQINIIFAPSGPKQNRVVAVTRRIGWSLAPVPAVNALLAKHGDVHLGTKISNLVWTQDPALFMAAREDNALQSTCFSEPFQSLIRSSPDARNVSRDCGAFLAAAEGDTSAAILLLDSTHVLERRTARHTMTLNRAKMTAEAVEF